MIQEGKGYSQISRKLERSVLFKKYLCNFPRTWNNKQMLFDTMFLFRK